MTAIYTLPHTESLDLGYLELRVLLHNLNVLARKIRDRGELYTEVGRYVGACEKTMYRKVREHSIQYDKARNRYYVTNNNPILNKLNIQA